MREFRWDDLEGVHALWRRCFGGLKPEDAEAPLRRTVERNHGLFLVEEQDGRIVGSVLATTDGRRGYLYRVAIDADVRRQGFGRMLVLEACRRIRERGAHLVHLRVAGDDAVAVAFYESLGMTKDLPVIGMHVVMDRAP